MARTSISLPQPHLSEYCTCVGSIAYVLRPDGLYHAHAVTYYPREGRCEMMVALAVVLVFLFVQQFYLYLKVQKLFGLVATLAVPILDSAYPGFPSADEEIFNYKQIADLATDEHVATL